MKPYKRLAARRENAFAPPRVCKEPRCASTYRQKEHPMMTINSAFDAFRETRQTFCAVSAHSGATTKPPGALMLRGIEIAIETSNAVYTLSSETPLLESSDPSRATAWPRWVFRLPNGSSIEQQMVLPRGHNAVAFSWRLLDESASPVAAVRDACLLRGQVSRRRVRSNVNPTRSVDA